MMSARSSDAVLESLREIQRDAYLRQRPLRAVPRASALAIKRVRDRPPLK
jgi:hypothetical protein